jgi:anti-sigma28 factor (negative regulator of flagellin synthesis)
MANVKPAELKVKIEMVFDEERLQEMFENQDVKFSKAKVNRLKKIIEECQYELDEILEDALEEFLNDSIQEEWGE